MKCLGLILYLMIGIVTWWIFMKVDLRIPEVFFGRNKNSCMNNNIQYHSAISREAIVKRIMLYAGETYSFDEFVKNDKRGSDNLSRSTRDMDFGTKARGNQYPPVIHKGRPSILK